MDTPCWEYEGPSFHNPGGYGMWHGLYAHREAYRAWYGEIPEGAEVIMHLCENPPCMNPLHLKAGSQRENIQMSVAANTALEQGRKKAWESLAKRNRSGKMARRSLKLYGKCGHPLYGPNLYLRPDGRRRCRECGRKEALARYHRNRK